MPYSFSHRVGMIGDASAITIYLDNLRKAGNIDQDDISNASKYRTAASLLRRLI